MKKILLFIAPIIVFLSSCNQDNPIIPPPQIQFLSGDFTQEGAQIPVGGKLIFGIRVNGGGKPLTNIRVLRITDNRTIVEIDKGVFIEGEDFEYVVNAVKSDAQIEEWRFVAMNANRDTAEIRLSVNLGEGTSYSPIKHFPSIRIGMQDNSEYPFYLDLDNGEVYTNQTVTGNEALVDLVGFVYYTSGVVSPTLCCPQYTTAPGYYPSIGSWSTRNSTLYDYNAVDNNLVSAIEFASAKNDSLLVASYKPGSVSGNCKFCFTNKIVPFKTEQGKFGLIRVIHADQTSNGYMELEVKVQE
jgi:hypothetical protein